MCNFQAVKEGQCVFINFSSFSFLVVVKLTIEDGAAALPSSVRAPQKMQQRKYVKKRVKYIYEKTTTFIRERETLERERVTLAFMYATLFAPSPYNFQGGPTMLFWRFRF